MKTKNTNSATGSVPICTDCQHCNAHRCWRPTSQPSVSLVDGDIHPPVLNDWCEFERLPTWRQWFRAAMMDAWPLNHCGPQGKHFMRKRSEGDGHPKLSYIRVITEGGEGTINLMWGDYPVAWVRSTRIAREIMREIPEQNDSVEAYQK